MDQLDCRMFAGLHLWGSAVFTQHHRYRCRRDGPNFGDDQSDIITGHGVIYQVQQLCTAAIPQHEALVESLMGQLASCNLMHGIH